MNKGTQLNKEKLEFNKELEHTEQATHASGTNFIKLSIDKLSEIITKSLHPLVHTSDVEVKHTDFTAAKKGNVERRIITKRQSIRTFQLSTQDADNVRLVLNYLECDVEPILLNRMEPQLKEIE